ncbi:MAG: phosphatase PAP2 family protein, partial [Candidatus Thorarchaeota archaeon]
MGWFFDEAINIWLQNNAPWLKWPMILVTYFGDAIIYIALLAVAFWIYNKREAIIAIYILLTANFFNFFLKVLIKNPRPSQSIRIVEESGFSTPSNHAQASSTMYGWIMFHFKKIWLYIVIPILVLLIAFSRVFLGVHYIGDVIIGLLIGIASVAALYFSIPPLVKWIDSWPDWVKVLVGECYGLVIFLITFLLGLFTEWPPGDETNSAETAAALLIFPILIFVENKWIKMQTDNILWWSKLLRVVVGLAVTVGVFIGIDYLFGLIPQNTYVIEYIFDFLKYTCVIAVVGLLMPFTFTK